MGHLWEYFEKLDSTRAKCRHCSKVYAADTKRNGTTKMRFHIQQCPIIREMRRRFNHKGKEDLKGA